MSSKTNQTAEGGTDIIPFEQISDLRGPIDEENNIFIRPRSLGITAIWYKFVLLEGDWYWTPYSDLKDWISVNLTIVPTGFYQGHAPASPNIKIIHYLRDNQPIPPKILHQLQPNSKLLTQLKFTPSNVSFTITNKLQYSYVAVNKDSTLIIFKSEIRAAEFQIDLICNNGQSIVRIQQDPTCKSNIDTPELCMDMLCELQMLKRNDMYTVFGFIREGIVSKYGLIIPHDIKQLILNIYKQIKLFRVKDKINRTDKWSKWNVKTTQFNLV